MMEELEDEAPPRGSLEFVESSVLTTLVAAASDLNIEEALNGSVERLDEADGSPLALIPQRQSLFFGQWPLSGLKYRILLIHRS